MRFRIAEKIVPVATRVVSPPLRLPTAPTALTLQGSGEAEFVAVVGAARTGGGVTVSENTAASWYLTDLQVGVATLKDRIARVTGGPVHGGRVPAVAEINSTVRGLLEEPTVADPTHQIRPRYIPTSRLRP